MKNSKDFDPSKIYKVPILDVEPNEYNPKEKDTPEYHNVVESIRLNGLKQPIFVREVKDNEKYVIVDGEQRWTAAKELGYDEIYIYNLGQISEEEAKALTIWFEVQVPFLDIELAPIVVELTQLDFSLPYTEHEIEGFKTLATFDMEEAFKDNEPLDEAPKMAKFSILVTPEQLDIINGAIKTVRDGENVNEGRALELLVSKAISEYPFNGTDGLTLQDDGTTED